MLLWVHDCNLDKHPLSSSKFTSNAYLVNSAPAGHDCKCRDWHGKSMRKAGDDFLALLDQQGGLWYRHDKLYVVRNVSFTPSNSKSKPWQQFLNWIPLLEQTTLITSLIQSDFGGEIFGRCHLWPADADSPNSWQSPMSSLFVENLMTVHVFWIQGALTASTLSTIMQWRWTLLDDPTSDPLSTM